MPYSVMESADCPTSKPWACKNTTTGQIMGCHATQADAMAQQAALMMSEGMSAKPDRGRREHRALRSEVRVPNDGSRTFEAIVVRYGVVDDYDTIFDAGCFKASLEQRMPRITWAHDWAEPLGRYVDYTDTPESLTLIGEFDDFDAVPRARQAWTQLQSGTIDQFSVGFHRIAIREDADHRTHFTEAGLDEAALVLVGAVPGTALVSVRSGLQIARQVPMDYLDHLSEQVASGKMTKDAALVAIELAGGEAPAVVETPTETEPVDIGELDADAEAFTL